MRDDQPPAADAAAHAGLAHVASASFLGSRIVPTGGYGVALAGGVALARAAQVAGARTGWRALWSARRVPSMAHASAILDRLGSGGALGDSARALVEHARDVPRRPRPLAAAVLRWVAVEAASFRAVPAAPVTPRLRTAWRDRVLVAAVITAVAGAVVAAA